MQIQFLKNMRGKVDTKNYSQGVAFVEFTEHQHALVALRVLNSNPGTVFHNYTLSQVLVIYEDWWPF